MQTLNIVITKTQSKPWAVAVLLDGQPIQTDDLDAPHATAAEALKAGLQAMRDEIQSRGSSHDQN